MGNWPTKKIVLYILSEVTDLSIEAVCSAYIYKLIMHEYIGSLILVLIKGANNIRLPWHWVQDSSAAFGRQGNDKQPQFSNVLNI